MLILLGEYPEAELWSRKALEVFKNHPDLLAGRAQAFGRLGDKRQAMGACDQALAQPGESAYRWVVRGELMVDRQGASTGTASTRRSAADPDWLVPGRDRAATRCTTSSRPRRCRGSAPPIEAAAGVGRSCG